VIQKISTELQPPEQNIIAQGSKADGLYFLTKGECIVKVIDENREERKVSKIMAGALFGEIGLLTNCTRTASVMPMQYSIIAKLKRLDFTDMCT
jgi:CRP-like cAMP-binding protein